MQKKENEKATEPAFRFPLRHGRGISFLYAALNEAERYPPYPPRKQGEVQGGRLCVKFREKPLSTHWYKK